MVDDSNIPDPIDENQPIPGSPYSRLTRAAGLFIAALILAFFIWFIITNFDRSGGGSMFG